jgi:putative transposase
MYVVALAIHLHQLSLEIRTDLGEDMSQLFDSLAIEDASAVFGHKDQMDMHCENTVSAMSKVLAFIHRPEYTSNMVQRQAVKYDEPEDKDRFVFEAPLRTTSADEREIEIRIQAYKEVKNACLGEALRRVDLCRESKEYQAARKMPRGEYKSKEQKARSKAFRLAFERFKFNEYDLHKFANQCAAESGWIKEHLGAHEIQKACSESFRSVEQFTYGKKGRPRFKSFRRARSIEGKSNATGIRWRKDHVEWGGLELFAILDPKDKDAYEAQALGCETALCRIVRRAVRGRNRYFVQLVQKGAPPKKAKNIIGKQSCGIDVGPSTVAVVGETEAGLFNLAESVVQPWKQTRLILRAMDRSRRATNPDNYETDGTVKKGAKTWNRSNNYLSLLNRLREIERILAACRKRDHGKLQNIILRIGIPNLEKLSYVAFQKMFGRSSKVRASGTFVSGLKRKAENAGGEDFEFSTRYTRCSQTCLCGELKKKPLSQRQHVCDCGVNAQRDLFSAYLARFVYQDGDKDRLDVLQARKAWTGMDNLLELAASNLNQLVSVDANGVYHISDGVGAGCQLNLKGNQNEVGEVVATAAVGAS